MAIRHSNGLCIQPMDPHSENVPWMMGMQEYQQQLLEGKMRVEVKDAFLIRCSSALQSQSPLDQE